MTSRTPIHNALVESATTPSCFMGPRIKSQPRHLNSDSELSYFFSFSPDKCRESTLSVVMIASFQIPAHSCITVTLDDTLSEVVPTSSKRHINMYSRIPLIRKLVFRIANYPDRLCPSGKFVENSIKIKCIKITGYRIKYSTVLWLLEFQIRPGRKVRRQVHTVNLGRVAQSV
jgi:hypothetical protein